MFAKINVQGILYLYKLITSWELIQLKEAAFKVKTQRGDQMHESDTQKK